MTPAIEFDVQKFESRALQVFDALQNQSDLFNGAEALLIATGHFPEELQYPRGGALQTWLFGYEVPDTILAFRLPNTFLALSSAKKVEFIRPLGTEKVDVVTIVKSKSKDPDAYRPQFDELITALGGPGTKVGVAAKDKFEGPFIDAWNRASESVVKEVDVTTALSELLAVKDEAELDIVKTSAKAAAAMMDHCSQKMFKFIDQEKKVTHAKLSDRVEGDLTSVLSKPEYTGKYQFEIPDQESVEFAYPPIIMSGGRYDLRVNATSDDRPLHAGIIIAEIGIRYRSYSSNVARTFLISPSAEQESHYKFLCELQQELVTNVIKDGVPCNEVYSSALSYLRKHRPELDGKFVKSIGFGTGLIYRESPFLLNSKNERRLRGGMLLNLAIGLNDLKENSAKDTERETYALFIADTIVVPSAEGGTAEILTELSRRSLHDVSLFFEDAADEDAENLETVQEERGNRQKSTKSSHESSRPNQSQRSTGHRPRTRHGNDPLGENQTADEKRRENQRRLAAIKIREGRERFSTGDGTTQSEKIVKVRKFESFKAVSQLPKDIGSLQILIDPKNETIILPVYGLPTPVHITTVRNCTKTDEGDHVILRLNFVDPTNTKDIPFGEKDATFIRRMCFRSLDKARLAGLHRRITDLKKSSQKRELERKEREDVQEQGELVEVGPGRRPLKLPDLYERPFMEGRRAPGELEIHQNGLRYSSPIKHGKIDILFSNIKHLFCQPCTNELVVLIHLHLRAPIVVGKKKTLDFQVYREASDVQYDETGNRRRRFGRAGGDEDEMQEEEEERRRRRQLNLEFQNFAQKIQEASKGELEVDSPYRKLGFYGVPQRTNVLLQPTINALVHLSDPPFLVVTLADIEWVHLERVQYGLKNFDMVIVPKDFSKPVTTIASIPMDSLDSVKEWLDNVEMAFSEGTINLKWKDLMKMISNDPAEFFEQGGWEFLLEKSLDNGAGDSEDDEDDALNEPSESEYEPSGSGEDEEDDSEEESDTSDGESSEVESSEGDGEDWEAHEKKARRYDERQEDRIAELEKASANGRSRSNGRMSSSKKRSQSRMSSSGRSGMRKRPRR